MPEDLILQVLQPIAESDPCGPPLKTEVLRELDQLEKENRWDELLSRSLGILSSQSKDLRVAVQLLKSITHGRGFAGSDDGLKALVGLVTGRWLQMHPRDPGEKAKVDLWGFLSPSDSREDASLSSSSDLFQIWKDLPLTRPANGSGGYSLRDYDLCRSRKAMTPWQEGVQQTPKVFYDGLRDHLLSIRKSYAAFSEFLGKQASSDPEGADFDLARLRDGRGKIDEYTKLIEASRSDAHVTSGEVQDGFESVSNLKRLKADKPNEPVVPSIAIGPEDFRTSLDVARQNWPNGLRQVAADGAREMSGRSLFLLKLEIAKLYLEKGHYDLAGVILDGLNKQATDRALEQWEGRSFVAEVKALLCRCRELEKKDQEALQLREELCQLAPWLALDARPQAKS